ncbi:MAG: calcium/sodium antiporter [Clostridia bacterium]|nr:calcium/sodium antiporter [Clostridia bacterium]
MQIFLNIVYLIGGLALLIVGANYFVSGASALAKKMKVPTIIIGLTIVAIGTSLPELVVGVITAIQGNSDISIGNVVGSNMANMLLIVGVVACMKPINVKRTTRKFDLPFLGLVSILLLLFGSDKYLDSTSANVLSRVESVVFLLLLFYYLYRQIKAVKKPNELEFRDPSITEEVLPAKQEEEETVKDLKGWQIALFMILGLGGVVGGGELVSISSKFLALKMGMSDALVGLTVVALGTSLPELVTSIVAVKKGEHELALGNVLGSNIMNIVLILGMVGAITPVSISTDMLVDLLIMACCTIAFIIMCYTKKQISRIEGVILLTIYAGYLAFAIARNYAF